MNKITPCLWFDYQAEEAVIYYMTIFADGEILEITRHPENTPGLAGKVLTIHFRIAGMEFIALNGGPMCHFSEAVSFSIECKDQEEIDRYWSLLTDGGEESMCGWLKDRFGLSWQVVPANLGDWLYHPDPVKSKRAMDALFQMRKIDLAILKKAVE